MTIEVRVVVPSVLEAFFCRPEPMKSRAMMGKLLVAGRAPAAESMQVKPGSILQVDEQPSPLNVLPSSHASSEKR